MTAPLSHTSAPPAALETVATWLEHAGYVLRRVHSEQYVFRHPALGALVTVPADPQPATVARLMALVGGPVYV